jgi:hypothetical protein
LVCYAAAFGICLLIGAYTLNQGVVTPPHAAPNGDAGMTPDGGTSGAGLADTSN